MSGDNTIRVLQLGSQTGLYGAERWMLALVRNARNSDVEFTVGVIKDTVGPEPPLCVAARNIGAPTHVFEALGKTSWRAVRQVQRFVDERGIHVIHTHGYKPDLLAAIVALRTRCRIITTPHGWSAKAGIKLQAYEALDRLVFACFHAVAPLSQELYEGLVRLPWLKARTVLIPNGVDLVELDTASESVAHEVVTAKSLGQQIVGYVGQLIPRKGLLSLIRAVATLNSRDVALFIVGDGPQRSELERFARQCGIAERVRFVGFRPDRLAFMKGFDIFVLPSELEGVPRCLMESMALGVPVLASNIPGCRALVQSGITGTLVEVGNHVELSRAISMLLASVERRKEMAAKACEYVREHYSARTMSMRYAELYRRIADRRVSG